MYRILMGISRELSNIKQIMSEEGEERKKLEFGWSIVLATKLYLFLVATY